MKYNFSEIEKKWQLYWKVKQTFKTDQQSIKPKYYVLDMFPYPSGAGLHVGHPLGYIASDIVARYKRHKGFNVLHPQGFDSFGLPAEQYAIQTGQHPAKTTAVNIIQYKSQLNRIGFSFDWYREVQTSDPAYYKWTQWIFLQLFGHYYDYRQNKALPIRHLIKIFENNGNYNLKVACDSDISFFSASEWMAFSWKERQEILLKYRLTYLAESEVNWCEELGTVLANDEVIDGVSERGGYAVVKKRMPQWSMRITAYAQRLLDGLETIDWPEPLKEMQRNWIGKSIGAKIRFAVKGGSQNIEVFTTRPDTIFGATYLTVAPEHPLVSQITTPIQQSIVQEYVDYNANMQIKDRMIHAKQVSGVNTGSVAIHPFTGAELPIWISNYVLLEYGTGAIMAVPCGDQRDYLFAKHFNLPLIEIFDNVDISEEAFMGKSGFTYKNSDFLDGLKYGDGIKKILDEIEAKGIGERYVNFRLRDAIFARQRYWGEPIPIYYKEGIPIPLKLINLPLVLPEVEKYLPTKTGDPPLGNADEWAWDEEKQEVVKKDLIDNVTIFPLELNTMPGWAGSSWYFNRYMDSLNEKEFASSEALSYWRDVDLYIGGIEHATGHLLYSRFWQKFLYDINKVSTDEYAKKLINQGMILGNSAFVYREKGTQNYISKNLIDQDSKLESLRVSVDLVDSSNRLDIVRLKQWQPHFHGATFELENGDYIVGREVEKMSKSKYNEVNPDQICSQYGADTLRMYEMFLGPIHQSKPWNTAGITGVHNFLKKFWKLFFESDVLVVNNTNPTLKENKILHQTIKKVTNGIEKYSFNTCVSSFMIAVNRFSELKCRCRKVLEPFTILLSPFAPHISEELWYQLGNRESIANQPYPIFKEEYVVEDKKEYPISFNGKKRFTLEMDLDLNVKEIERIVLRDRRTIQYIREKEVKKVIVVPNRIVNIVVF